MSLTPSAVMLIAVVLPWSLALAQPENDDARAQALNLSRLGFTYEREGKYAEARHAFEDAISRLIHLDGENARSLLQPLNGLANLLFESNQNSRAETLVHRSLAILASTGPADRDTGVELALLAKIYHGEGKLALAQQAADESLRVLRDTGHSEDFAASVCWSVLGAVYNEQRDMDNAAESLRKAFTITLNTLRPGDYRIAEAKANLGLLYASHGSTEKGETLLEEAYTSFHTAKLNSVFVRGFLVLWADIERKAGNKARAKDLLKEADALMAGSPEASMSRYIVDAHSFH